MKKVLIETVVVLQTLFYFPKKTST